MSNLTIKTIDLCKFYGEKHALYNISFDVRKGEIFGLLGPNGAGKTTLIKILATLLLPSSGRALIEGLDVVKDAKKVRSIIGLYLAESGFYYRLKIRDFLQFFGRLYGLSGIELRRRIQELLEFFQLEDKADEEINALSHGMRRKLHLARALLHNPSVLLLDEPTIGLDPISAKDLRDRLKQLSREGTTVLLSTHYMPEAEEYCDRVLLLNLGKVVAIDSPQNLIRRHGGFQVIEVLYDQKRLSMVPDRLKTLVASRLKRETDASIYVLKDGRLKVYSKNADEMLPGLADALVQLKVQVRSITIAKPTLEDVFHKLVAGMNGG
ncbi:ABC transporter ATP-binding protein [Candidatus Bathyarchaeota archaeon]|nr:MAG: ABC transporter ATP-binding protein [Candidatus Bathyarchaeota archaeon]